MRSPVSPSGSHSSQVRKAPMPSIYDFATWEPALSLLRAANAETLAATGGHVAAGSAMTAGPHRFGCVSRLTVPPRSRTCRRSSSPSGRCRQRSRRPAGTHHGSPSRRWRVPGHDPPVRGRCSRTVAPPARPEPNARPHQSADPVFLERILRERFPNATGAIEEELTAAEARLGIPLPDELEALYRVVRGRTRD